MLTVSVVIRTLNEAQYLDDLLAMVQRQKTNGLTVESVVIDSGSTDGTVEIAHARGARVTTISQQEFSFGRALNRGCDFSTGDLLVFVSGHCVPVDENWIQALCQPLIDGVASYSYGRQIADDDSNFSERVIFSKYFPPVSAIPQDGFFCNNANSAMLRSAWRAFAFDEELTGLEDMEMAKRMVAAGHKVAYVAEAPVFHHHNETWQRVRRRFEREALALQQIMPEVQLTRLDVVRCILASTFGDWRAAWQNANTSTSLRDIFLYRYNQYIGSYRGNHEHRLLSLAAKQKYFYPDPTRKAENDVWLRSHRRTASHEGE